MTIKYRSRNGDLLAIDTSNKAILEFGFNSDEKILIPRIKKEGRVIGVAILPCDMCTLNKGDIALWIQLNGEDDLVTFPDPKNDLEKIYETITQARLEIDTSDKACRKFGFEHNDKVILPLSGDITGTIIGVADMPEEPDVIKRNEKLLWIHLDDTAINVLVFSTYPKSELKKI